MGGKSCKYVVEGSVEPGYETVRELFENNFKKGAEEHAQLCVYVAGKKVIDLWGSNTTTTTTTNTTANQFTGDSLTTVFSSTKSLTAILLAIACDRGWLRYTDTIVSHWPEFGGGHADKDMVTVAELMRHESGLSNLDTMLEADDALPAKIRENAVGAKVAASSQKFPAHGRRSYHALTRGWVANEIFRRVHPDGATLGEFLQTDLTAKLGGSSEESAPRVFIGCDDPDYFPVRNIPPGLLWRESAKVSLGIGRDSTAVLTPVSVVAGMTYLALTGKSILELPIKIKFPDGVNTPVGRRVEGPSYNGNASARGLALIAAAMANRGRLNSVNGSGGEILSPEAWQAMHDNVTDDLVFGPDGGMVGFSQGGLGKMDFVPARAGFWGWFGYGGSVFQWHPELDIGFAFTCTLLHTQCFTNQRAADMQAAVVECVKNLAASQ